MIVSGEEVRKFKANVGLVLYLLSFAAEDSPTLMELVKSECNI